MRGRDELVVGATMLFGLLVIVAGAFWLSQLRPGQSGNLYEARFRTVGGLGVGNPVVLRGVRVGRVQEIRLADGEWVETGLQIYADVEVPDNPAVIAASASLFGEWQAGIIHFDDPIDDPNVRRDLEMARAEGEDVWPGATLPDIGQLTAQAGRIASDIASFSTRIEKAFDDEVVENLQLSIRDFTSTANQINRFADQQMQILGEVTDDFRTTTGAVSQTAQSLERTMARIDSATEGGRLDDIVSNVSLVSSDLQTTVQSFRNLIGSVADRQASIGRIMGGADSVFTRLERGEGTIGRLVADSTLYVEASKAVAELRALLADIKENPRKYFKFSVF